MAQAPAAIRIEPAVRLEEFEPLPPDRVLPVVESAYESEEDYRLAAVAFLWELEREHGMDEEAFRALLRKDEELGRFAELPGFPSTTRRPP